MKSGDKVKITSNNDTIPGKIVRFYANQGTVLVEMTDGKLVYLNYQDLEKNSSVFLRRI